MKDKPTIKYNAYDQVWLMGAGTQLTAEQFARIDRPVIAFGWSDPNMYIKDHMLNSSLYCTNDLKLSRKLAKVHPTLYYQTSCDKKHHVNLNLDKSIDILVYGVGKHKFIGNRNDTVNALRKAGLSVTVFGREWDWDVHTHDFMEGDKFIEMINKAHISIDITNSSSAFAHRVLECTACGTPVLSKKREDLLQMFKEGKEVLTYEYVDDMIDTLKKYLKKPDMLRKIGLAGQKRCYAEHDISVSVPKLLKILAKVER